MEDKIFREFLEKKGLKFTKERAAVLKEVFSNHNHFDPDDLYVKMKGQGMKVSKASVYRTLPLLLECGLVEQVERFDKHAHYEHTFGHGHHDHLICIKCGKVIPLFSEKLEKLQESLCKQEKFRCLTHILEIKGYCSKCEEKGQGGKQKRPGV
ncbi:MAG: transcriptional repressor [Nitrospirae bacterium]|nr:transcriptional repressor [Nitrospirota bacterium]